MNVLQGAGQSKLAGCIPGDILVVTLITGQIDLVILDRRDRDGIHGFQQNQVGQPPVFYPFSAILKIKKYTEIQEQ